MSNQAAVIDTAFDLPPPEARAATATTAPTPASLGDLLHEWSPVIGRDLRPLGVRVQIRRLNADRQSSATLAATLDAVVNGFMHEGGASFPHGWVILAPQDMALDASMLTWNAPRNVVLELPASVLQDEVSLRSLLDVHRCGARFALRLQAHEPIPDNRRLALFQYVVTDVARLQGQSSPLLTGDAHVIALDDGNTAHATEALKGRLHAVAGWALVSPNTITEHALAPMQQAVLNLIRLAQTDAEVEALESAFKGEPILSYMLLTLANSPAFIRTTPIASLRHAITLLGYRRLVKWLVLLLVVASKNAKALPQIYGAVARGFLMENLAAANRASPNTQDECFVVGAFSLMGAITGQPLPALLQQVALPEAVVNALLHQTGPLACYLKLALAMEHTAQSTNANPLAERIVTATHDAHLELEAVNRALLQALCATDALQSVV